MLSGLFPSLIPALALWASFSSSILWLPLVPGTHHPPPQGQQWLKAHASLLAVSSKRFIPLCTGQWQCRSNLKWVSDSNWADWCCKMSDCPQDSVEIVLSGQPSHPVFTSVLQLLGKTVSIMHCKRELLSFSSSVAWHPLHLWDSILGLHTVYIFKEQR